MPVSSCRTHSRWYSAAANARLVLCSRQRVPAAPTGRNDMFYGVLRMDLDQQEQLRSKIKQATFVVLLCCVSFAFHYSCHRSRPSWKPSGEACLPCSCMLAYAPLTTARLKLRDFCEKYATSSRHFCSPAVILLLA